eukprot:s1037_g10.t1
MQHVSPYASSMDTHFHSASGTRSGLNAQPPLVEEELMTQVGGLGFGETGEWQMGWLGRCLFKQVWWVEPLLNRTGMSNSLRALEDASLEELASALTTKLDKDKDRAKLQLFQLKEAERQLEEKQQQLDELEKRIFAMTDGLDDVIELNDQSDQTSSELPNQTRSFLCQNIVMSSACVVAALLLNLFHVGLAFRTEVVANTSTAKPDCAAWYEVLPGKFKAKFGWTSSDRKDYLSKTPDPCAEAGLECCGGQCALPGCETDVECLQCKALMAGSSIPSEVQKEICEDPKFCSNMFYNNCAYLAGECTRKKQTCDACTKSYKDSAPDVAKASCENTDLCYLPQIGTYKEGGCLWNGFHKRCERGPSERHDAYKDLFEGMFSGNFDASHKRDKDDRIFLDVDPPLFEKVLRHLRLRRIASPDQPAPLPHVPEELRAEWDMMIKYFGLDVYMYGKLGVSCNIFQRIAEMNEVDQAKLQENDLVRITLSSTGGVPSSSHQEVLGGLGFSERSLENSYGAYPNSITIKFLKHRVKVEAMELRAKIADVLAHMSNKWTFKHGQESVNMSYSFSRSEPGTGRLDTPGLGQAFVDEVVWLFPRDFCLEHIVLWGHVGSVLEQEMIDVDECPEATAQSAPAFFRRSRAMVSNPELRGDDQELQQLLEDEQLGAALRRSYVPHWLHLGWISSTAGAAVKGIPIPQSLKNSEEKIFQLKDGGTVSLDWWQQQRSDRPVVLVLPGMANSSRSIYIRYTMARLDEAGFQAVAMNYRAVEHLEITSPHLGCADTWKDLPEVLDVIEETCPKQPIFAMGFSMGGTILTKYLGEQGENCRIRAAVAVSCPLAYPAHQAELEKRKVLSFLMAQPLKLWLFKKRAQIAKLWPHCEMSQVMSSGSLLTVAGYFFDAWRGAMTCPFHQSASRNGQSTFWRWKGGAG